MFDLILRNGLVVDGSGDPAYTADVGVCGDKITAIGVLPPEADTTDQLDCAGMVVAPGFIDIHTHADIALLAHPPHLPKVMQGITTEVFTNCGLGFAPASGEGLAIQRKYLIGLFGDSEGVDWEWRSVADLLTIYEKQGIGANIVYLIPHGSVRVSVMGMEERISVESELKQMEAMVLQGMEEGAWGLSTGLWYAPMKSASLEETVRLSRIAGFFATHQRDYENGIFPATEESVKIAREAHVPVQISHLQMNGPENKGKAPQILDLLDKARESGVDVSCDIYPYTAGSTLVQALLPGWAAVDGPEGLMKLLSDQKQLKRIEASLDDNRDWSVYFLAGATSKKNSPLEGLSFPAASRKRGMSVPEWIGALLQEESLQACFIHHNAHEENVRDIMRWRHQMFGSDGLHLTGKSHPRLYGAFPRALAKYVREEKVITLEDAIWKMTGAPASRLGIKGRGFLKVGYAADIVVFNRDEIDTPATFENPSLFPSGIPYVLCNGVPVKWNNSSTGSIPGKVLRKNQQN